MKKPEKAAILGENGLFLSKIGLFPFFKEMNCSLYDGEKADIYGLYQGGLRLGEFNGQSVNISLILVTFDMFHLSISPANGEL